MKSYLLYILAFFLAVTITAPSLVSLIGSDEKLELVLEHGEDENQKENKEGEKESSDKDTFYHLSDVALSDCLNENKISKIIYIEGYYNHTLNIFLPPPKIG